MHQYTQHLNSAVSRQRNTNREQNGVIRDYMYTYVNNVNIHGCIADVHKLISKAH